MKSFKFVVSGNLLAEVSAKTDLEAEEKLQDYLDDNSPLRDWEVSGWGEYNLEEKADISI